jgi:hypothetical protein
MSKFIEPNVEQVYTTTIPTQADNNSNFRLWTLEDFDKLKRELTNEQDYKLLKDDKVNGYKLWVKSSGEGSGIYVDNFQYDDIEAAKTSFLRHKYSCEFDFPVQAFYDATRDYKNRVEWDHRTIYRNILNIYKSPQSTPQLKNQLLEHMIKRTGPMMADRDCVTLSAELWEGETCYFFTKSVDSAFAEKVAGVPEHIRSNVLYLGMCLEPTNDGKSMRYSCVTQLSPNGWIISGLMNWATKFIPKAFRREMIHAVDMRSKKNPAQLQYINYMDVNLEKPEQSVEQQPEQPQEQQTEQQEQQQQETVVEEHKGEEIMDDVQ